MSSESNPRRISRKELIHYPFRHPDKALLLASKTMAAGSIGSLIWAGLGENLARYTQALTRSPNIPASEKASLEDDVKYLRAGSRAWFGRFKTLAKSSFITYVASNSLKDPEKEFVDKTLGNESS